ncbi:MAG: shikimate dehydrogenase [Pseudomonadota bacterium]
MGSHTPRQKAFVVGHPIDHSRSPLIHGHWLARHRIEGEYVKKDCDPEAFAVFLASLKEQGMIGGNVTLPFKEQAFDLVDACTDTAQRLGAVNTLWFENERLIGDNTDGYGFLANLDHRAPGWDAIEKRERPVLVLGAGGAARAIVCGLQDRGFRSITVANRTESRAKTMLDDLQVTANVASPDAITDHLANIGTLINTTSIGMGDNAVPFGLDATALSACHPDAVVTDIVYAPLVTPLLDAARANGLTTVDGLGMLLHQAVPGFENWFGPRPKVDTALRNVILQDLGYPPDPAPS